MEIYSSHLKTIIKANDESRLAVFVGAGISLSSNTESFKLPLWSDLIDSMKRELQLENESDYLKIAQLYFLEFEEPTYYRKIKSFFPDNIPPSELHKVIFELMPQCVITTNWDSILEDTIDESGALYSVICSDKDLVKSTNLKKLIKMHGDFKNHNIVFKEDDYINYAKKSPLIENYIKSILSTHTILFIGYSYNDINLKNIMKWLQNSSDYSPPMYLTTHRANEAQKQYLKSHGINSITLKNETKNKKINSRFEKLSSRSKQTATFLENIKLGLFEDEENLTSKEIVELIYRKIEHLEILNFILLDQIRAAFTNCGFVYTKNAMPILELFNEKGVLTTNYNLNTRLIHEKFISVLKKQDENKLACNKTLDIVNKIMGILAKANIAGVIISENENHSKNYFVNEKISNASSVYNENLAALDFSTKKEKATQSKNIDQLSRQAINYFQEFDYPSAYQATLETILLCKRQKNYTCLLIALFNANTLIYNLKYSTEHLDTKKYDNLEVFDLQEQFFQLPKTDIKKQQTLFDFLTFRSIYTQTISNSNNLIKINNSIESIKRGGISFNSEADKPLVEHSNLLLFSIKNHLLIDDSAFNQMMSRFVEISIARQSIKKTVYLNSFELFTCIKHVNDKELKTIFSIFGKNDNGINYLELPEKNIDWLVNDVLKNIMNRYLNASSPSQNPENELRNIIVIISCIKLNEENTTKVLKEFSRLLSSKNNTIKTYESINSFFSKQHHLFENKIDTDLLVELIENIINKVVYRNSHGWDNFAISKNTVENLYGYIEVNNDIYSNTKLIKKLVFELEDFSTEDKIKYSKSLLYSIFRIGSIGIKTDIRTFIESVISEIKNNTDDTYIFKLWCVDVGFLETLDDQTVADLEKYLGDFEDSKVFHWSFYNLKDLIDHLINEKNITSLIKIQKILREVVENHDTRPNPSAI